MKKSLIILILLCLLIPSAFAEIIKGHGDTATKKIYLKEGLTIFEFSHNGARNFVIQSLDSNGDTKFFLANAIGDFKGSKAVNIKKAGNYLFNVTADGNWIIKITQPNPTNGEKKRPITLKGKGTKATEYLYFNKGLSKFIMHHRGQRNFMVQLFDTKGTYLPHLANKIGNYDGSKALKIERAGIYLLQVDADGDWSIEIE